jgi:radical SAM protein with 4Fe4S-binding SPASM domain
MKKDYKNSSLIDKSFGSAFNSCTPLVATIEITQNCNFKCLHCYNFDRSKPMPKDIRDAQLDPAQIIQTIDALAGLGTLYINISGGEALLHPHIGDFIKRIKSHNMEPRLKTNGFSLVDKIPFLKSCGVNSVDISLYGSSDESYKHFTGVNNGYSKTVTAIKECVKNDIDLNVNIILQRNNVDELEEMTKMCEDNLVNFQVSTETTERYDSSDGARDLEITDKQFESLLLGPYGHMFMVNNTERALQCSCARSVIGIGSNGDVYPCIGAPIISGNIKNNSLKSIWKNSDELNKIRNLKQESFKECATCDVIDYCSRSSGTCYVNSGNYTGCDPRYIAQATIRKNHSDKFKL